MRFIDVLGKLRTSRRYVSGGANVQEEEVKEPSKLAEILRLLISRVTAVEALQAPEGVEFEVEVGDTGAITSLAHNLKSQVRYTVVYWTKLRRGSSYPSAAPVLVVDESSTETVLNLQSYVVGRAIIRVEPAFTGVAFQD